jgi:hypothetical protein
VSNVFGSIHRSSERESIQSATAIIERDSVFRAGQPYRAMADLDDLPKAHIKRIVKAKLSELQQVPPPSNYLRAGVLVLP